MENQNDIRISIPKPCHEDWNKMSPNEKGAFCNKCAKTVVDFTKKTTEEIKHFFTEQTGKKICGRFMNDQLDEPASPISLYIPIHLLPKRLSFNKAFVFALFISFGTTLFSCSTTQGEVVGKIEGIQDTIISKKGEVKEIRTIGDTVYTLPAGDDKKQIKKSCTPLKGDVDIRPTLGEVEYPLPVDTTNVKDTLNEESIKTGKIKISEKDY